jgi:hypothetical protein
MGGHALKLRIGTIWHFTIVFAAIVLVPAIQGQALSQQSDFLVQLRPPGINTRTSAKGDEVRATVLQPPAFAGYEIVGRIGELQRSGKIKGSTELSFHFDRLENGIQIIPVSADLKQVTNSKGAPSVDEEGHAIKKKSNVNKLLLGAGGGAAIGALKGGIWGAAVGAAAGTGVALIAVKLAAQDGADFTLAPNSQLLLSVRPDQSRPRQALNSANKLWVGRFVNEKVPDEYLNLGSDGKFFLYEASKELTGSFQVAGGKVTLYFPTGTASARIERDYLVDSRGQRWVKAPLVNGAYQ